MSITQLISKRNKRPPQETPEARQKRSRRVSEILKRKMPDAVTALVHKNPFQLLIATILSAQCTDERVNMVTPALFARYPTPADFVSASQPELEVRIRSTGFFRMKAKSIIGCSRGIVQHHGGKVPRSIEELVKLRGVGRKTANVVLGQVFGISSGVVVDTHVFRVSKRLGFSEGANAEAVEQDLMKLFQRREWILLGTVLLLHGRRTCRARKPDCPDCSVRDLCPSADTFA